MRVPTIRAAAALALSPTTAFAAADPMTAADAVDTADQDEETYHWGLLGLLGPLGAGRPRDEHRRT